MLRQLCVDTVLIENNRATPEWDCNRFSNKSIVFKESSIVSIITELSQSRR